MKNAKTKRQEKQCIERATKAREIISKGVATGDTRVCAECHKPIAYKDIEAIHTDFGTFFSVEDVWDIVYGVRIISLWEVPA